MKHSQSTLLVLAASIASFVLIGCSKPYEPGLGELMSLTQMRHAKLWYAGEAANWELAEYEINELQEGFDDVVRFHPEHKGAPIRLTLLVPQSMVEPLRVIRLAVDTRDSGAFREAYDALTAGCNSCHQATNFGFNVVQRPPGQNWYGDQNFTGSYTQYAKSRKWCITTV